MYKNGVGEIFGLISGVFLFFLSQGFRREQAEALGIFCPDPRLVQQIDHLRRALQQVAPEPGGDIGLFEAGELLAGQAVVQGTDAEPEGNLGLKGAVFPFRVADQRGENRSSSGWK